MLIMGFFLAPFAGGAVLAALVDAAGAGPILAWSVFLITSLLLLLVVRPIARSHARMPAALRTGTAALIGSRGVVVERIANDEAMGAIKIENGEVWTARCYDEDDIIDVGQRVEVVEIRGATALVTE
jgi:membrane protein implicated in regulation of membrane protease activity